MWENRVVDPMVDKVFGLNIRENSYEHNKFDVDTFNKTMKDIFFNKKDLIKPLTIKCGVYASNLFRIYYKSIKAFKKNNKYENRTFKKYMGK